MRPGINEIAWHLEGGTIAVRVRGGRQDLPLLVSMASSNASNTEILARGDDHDITKRGLPFGLYQVSASQDDGLVSDIKIARIDAGKPSAAIDLVLLNNRARLFVTDAEGKPIPKALVKPMYAGKPGRALGWPLVESNVGEFALDNLKPGTNLLISADGYAAACRSVPRDESVIVNLESGRTVDVEVPIRIAAMTIAALDGVPGSNCPVPLYEFKPTQLGGQSVEGYGTFRFDHFPSVSQLFLLLIDYSRPITVPDHGRVLVH